MYITYIICMLNYIYIYSIKRDSSYFAVAPQVADIQTYREIINSFYAHDGFQILLSF